MSRATTREPAPIPPSALLIHAQQALGSSQRELGELLGISRSTIVRWHRSGPQQLLPSQLGTLVRALHPVDPGLASQVAKSQGATLESLGVVLPARAPAASPEPPPVAPLHPLVVDTVVCAAAEVVGQPPASVRPLLVAAFERARVVGLSVEEVLRGLQGSGGGGVAPERRARGRE